MKLKDKAEYILLSIMENQYKMMNTKRQNHIEKSADKRGDRYENERSCSPVHYQDA